MSRSGEYPQPAPNAETNKDDDEVTFCFLESSIHLISMDIESLLSGIVMAKSEQRSIAIASTPLHRKPHLLQDVNLRRQIAAENGNSNLRGSAVLLTFGNLPKRTNMGRSTGFGVRVESQSNRASLVFALTAVVAFPATEYPHRSRSAVRFGEANFL